MKRPFVFFAVGADLAFISACAVGSTVPEGIPFGDEAADQARIATELSVGLAASESPTSIEEAMPLHRRPSTPKDPERQATKGGQCGDDECRGHRREVLPRKSALLGMEAPVKVETNKSTTGKRPREALPNGSISPRGLKPSRAPHRVNDPNQIK
jgi:hypothetical protein